MAFARTILMRMFGRPTGRLGRLGGRLMARMNARWGAWICDQLRINRSERVLEVGFGPGVIIEHLSKLAPEGHVSGVDASPEMVAQARARNSAAIRSGHVDLKVGSVERLPFADNSFDKAVAINSMQVRPDPLAGLKELWRVLRPGAVVALGFTRHSGQSKDGVTEALAAAGFAQPHLVERADCGFGALAIKR